MANKKAIVLTNGILTEIASADEIDPQNLTNYFQKTEYVEISTGAPNSGDPVVLDNTGKLDISMIPVTGGGTTTINKAAFFTTYFEENSTNFEHRIHGGIYEPDVSGAVLNSGSPINYSKGISKIMVVINAGSDFTGSLTITGTSVDRDDQTTTADIDVITIDTLSTDNTFLDVEGNEVHGFEDAYISSKWFTGSITISTTDLTLTDVDVYSIAFEQVNSEPSFDIIEWDMTFDISNTNAWLYAYFYTVVVTGSKVDLINVASFSIPDGTALVKPYRKRESLLINLDGSTSGFFTNIFFGPGSLSYFKNIEHKITVSINQDVSATLDHGGLTGLSDDDHLQYHNDTRGDVRYTQRSNNLSDVSSSLTSFDNIKQSATDSFEGVVELATTPEVGTGTDNTRAVTPLGYKSNLLASNVGYTPSTLTDWDGGVDPGEASDALNQLASRLFTEEMSFNFSATMLTSQAGSPSLTVLGGSGGTTVWALGDSSTESVGSSFVYNGPTTSDYLVLVKWAMNTATSGNVRLQAGLYNSKEGASISGGGTAPSLTESVPASVRTMKTSTFNFSFSDLDDGDVCNIQIRRAGGDAADTATGDLYLLGFKVITQ